MVENSDIGRDNMDKYTYSIGDNYIEDSDELKVGELYWLINKSNGKIQASRCCETHGVKHFNTIWTDNTNTQGFTRWYICEVDNDDALLLIKAGL